MRWRFAKWQDGDVNVQKTLTLIGDITLTAYYEELVAVTATIRGYVYDATTGNPIAGAIVTCDAYSDVTEIDGLYELVSIPAAPYTITFQKEGYRTASSTVDASAGGTFQINAQLETAPPPPCVIATVAYGTPLAKEVSILRSFRDNFMARTSFGHWLSQTYYGVGKYVAKWLMPHTNIKRILRGYLDLIVKAVEAVLDEQI